DEFTKFGALNEYVCPRSSIRVNQGKYSPETHHFMWNGVIFAVFSPETASNGRYGMIFLIYYPV
ncbi:MAG: hypothetical protein KBT27_11005, partial [Prevotellaceae bacterium]|nr:hypothetical protein [Candidatus Faecinaster equi]